MQTPKEATQRYYQKKRKEQIIALHQEKRKEFLSKYPKWDMVKTRIKPNHVELLEKLHGLTPCWHTIQDIATEKGVSRQAIYDAHQRALKALNKAISKL